MLLCLLMSLTCRGKSASKHSGFGGDGGWDKDPTKLNNNYYKELLDFAQFELEFENNAEFFPFPNQFYWEEEIDEGAADGTFMLHADMALAFDMKGFLDSKNGNVTCAIVPRRGKITCPTSVLRPQSQEYANDNKKWITDFRSAYLKLVTAGCGAGKCAKVPWRVDFWLARDHM
jgi:catalase (peroxidase I)